MIEPTSFIILHNRLKRLLAENPEERILAVIEPVLLEIKDAEVLCTRIHQELDYVFGEYS